MKKKLLLITALLLPFLSASLYAATLTYSGGVWSPSAPNFDSFEDDIVILDGTAVLTEDIEVFSVTVESGAVLDLGGYTMIVTDGYIDCDGLISSDVTGVVIDGDMTLTGTGLISVSELSISTSSDVIIDTNLQVDLYGVLTTNRRSTLTINGTFTFKSTATDIGLTGPLGSGASITGEVITEHYYDEIRAYRFVSSPVTTTGGSKPTINDNWQEGALGGPTDNPYPGYGTHITGTEDSDNLVGLDATPGSGRASMFVYDNTNQEWGKVLNTVASSLTAGDAYRLFIRGDRSIDLQATVPDTTSTILRATGELVSGDVTFTDFPSAVDQFVFVGNPYQATVNMDDLVDNATDVDRNYMYVWDPELGDQGAYVTIALQTNTNSNANSDADRNLYPSMAALLYCRDVNANSTFEPHLVFRESYKVASSELAGVARQVEGASLRLSLYEAKAFATGNKNRDAVLVHFDNAYSNEVNDKDAFKINNIDETIGVKNADRLLSIEQRKLPVDGEVIPLSITNYKYSDYVLKTNLVGFASDVFSLYDKYTDKSYALTGDGETLIPFKVNDGDAIADDRFEVRYSTENLGTASVEAKRFSVFPNPVENNEFYIRTSSDIAQMDVVLTNMLGQKMMSKKYDVSSNNNIKIETAGFVSGIYLLTLTSGADKHTQKLIIK